jgi:hypothetical protein
MTRHASPNFVLNERYQKAGGLSPLVNTFAAANYNKSSYTYKLWGSFKTSGNGGYVR